MPDYFDASLLGLVQGLTEFLPISSTAHLRIVSTLTGLADPGAAYSAVIQLGSWVALLFYFRKDIYLVLRDTSQGLIQRNFHAPGSRLAIQLVIGTLPICIAGLGLADWIHGPLRSLEVIAASLIAVGLWMWAAEYYSDQSQELSDMNWKVALAIGLAQCLALVPGASRSGTTLAMALCLHFRRTAALRFSFLLSIPAIGLAGFYELLAEFQKLKQAGLGELGLGILVAALSSYICIALLLRFVRTHSTMVFALYRVLLGALVLVWVYNE